MPGAGATTEGWYVGNGGVIPVGGGMARLYAVCGIVWG
jgi:hypothetical protein